MAVARLKSNITETTTGLHQSGAGSVGNVDRISPLALLDALKLHHGANQHISDVARAGKFVQAADMLDNLYQTYDLPFVDLTIENIDPDLGDMFDPTLCLKHVFVPISRSGNTITLALGDPSLRQNIQSLSKNMRFHLRFVSAEPDAVLNHLCETHRDFLTQKARTTCPEKFSCRELLRPHNRRVLLGLAIMFCCLLGYFNHLGTGLVLWIIITLFFNTALKCICMIGYFRQKPRNIRPTLNLPKVSIMIPLLREENIVDRLILRMTRLKYPHSLLEICLVIEENDTMTRAHLNDHILPNWMRVVVVPNDTLQTKPRALNYALDFCQGDIIGVYDAEDAPEENQILTVAAHLQNGPENLACVQAALDYYNTRTNWLSRCFTIEYAILFRVILRGLQHFNLPIPLGGTSVFFKRRAIETLGRWDAHNVTEDAELGMRLYRLGWRCEVTDSTTYEEANYRTIPWIKQRSRWLKGFMVTWLTHMRRPRELIRDLGLGGFLTFNTMLAGTVSAYLSAPIVIPLWLLCLGFDLPIYNAISHGVLLSLIYGFVFTELVLMMLGFVATRAASLRRLTITIPTMVFYWPIGCFAAYKALYELIANPMYWDKTQHGINDQDCDVEIDRLTCGGNPIERAA
ncbi:glycosyl transferase [Amylibacter ulvae]|uniref:Glycosyl transferase n=1 Tax=Paramylibacter ulvae TaxID=1651968 RepID=A0ABQ3D2H7_9RHOB|nr:glycosyltransferase family 2 protein [Amylibacter ulvae]GHA55248.1 glycosyl transferase [Amylibacter ulvae]